MSHGIQRNDAEIFASIASNRRAGISRNVFGEFIAQSRVFQWKNKRKRVSKMVIRKCDRCNKEIKGNYWTIDIYEKEDATMRLTTSGATNNIQQNMEKMFNNQKEYCKECIEEIRKVINKC